MGGCVSPVVTNSFEARGRVNEIWSIRNVANGTTHGMSEVTQILLAIEQGDSQAASRLLPLVYDELRKGALALLAPIQQAAQLVAHVPANGQLSRKARAAVK